MTVMTKQAKMSGKMKNGVEVYATMTLPYTKDGIGNFMDAGHTKDENSVMKFAAIHSNPPGIPTQLPSLLRTKFGKGTVVWSASPIEAASREQHSNIFADIVRGLVKKPSLLSDAPDFVEIITFYVSEKKRFLISVIDVLDRFKIYKTGIFSIRIMSDKSPVRIVKLPNENPIPYSYNGNEITVLIDDLKVFEMIAIDW